MKVRPLIITALGLLTAAPLIAADPMVDDLWAEFNERMESLRSSPAPGRTIKIRDLVEISGEERVKMAGFGVVSGLNGTGDSGRAAIKLLLNVAERQGIRLSLDDIKKKNLALVSLSAEIDPYQRTFDVAAKSVGDAKSLQNGHLEGSTLSPLGTDEVYAVASGALALGARYFAASPAAGAVGTPTSVTIGHPTVGFVLGGGQLVKEIPSTRIEAGRIEMFLKHPNNRTSTNIANSINAQMDGLGIRAIPTNASTVSVQLDDALFARDGNLTRLIADIGDLASTVSRKATITVDQGSGVIAMTDEVKMEPGSIAVAGLTVTVASDITPVTRQGFLEGSTAFYDIPELEVSENQANFLTLPAGTDLREVQQTLNALKLTPTSIISVFSAMHKAGMIHADIVVIPR